MLRLKNIEKNNTQISANYFPEGSDEKGFVCIDITSQRILKSKKTSYDKPFGMYISHAKQALCEMLDSEFLPSERVVMWY